MMPQTWSEFREVLFNQAMKDRIPLTGQFELTARCNLHCKMCYVCKPQNDKKIQGQELSAEQWINLAKEARDAGMLYILLTGGEVFLRPDFKEIYENLINMGFRLSIYTNATLITPEIADWLGSIPPISVDVTLYGASSETYKKVTGYADAFERAINGIDLLLAQGINLGVRTTVIKDNAGDLDKLVELAEARDLAMRYSFYVSPKRGVNSVVNDSIRLSPNDIAEYELRASQAYNSFVEKKQKDLPIVEEIAVDNNNYSKSDSNSIHPFKCAAGKSEFWVTWDGRMNPCATMDEPSIMPLKVGFNNAWQELVSWCESIPHCNDCQQCSLRDVCWTCPARLKSETGKFDTSANYLCEWARIRQILL